MMNFPIHGKIENFPNHQPVVVQWLGFNSKHGCLKCVEIMNYVDPPDGKVSVPGVKCGDHRKTSIENRHISGLLGD